MEWGRRSMGSGREKSTRSVRPDERRGVYTVRERSGVPEKCTRKKRWILVEGGEEGLRGQQKSIEVEYEIQSRVYL